MVVDCTKDEGYFTNKTIHLLGRKFTIKNNVLTNLSDSPNHLLKSVDAEMLKNVAPHSAATALANQVLPVPSGPYKSTP